MNRNQAPIHILIVDDSPVVIRFASRVLRDSGAEISTAEDGLDALDMFRLNPPDLLVTDLMMPKMNGFELISAIRKQEGIDPPHIIVMTALDQIEDKVKALSMGANDYTVKPLDANEFRARVQTGIREVRLRKDLRRALGNLDYELRMVGNLQRRLLPKVLPRGDRFQAAASYQPCNLAGGDYYDCFLDSAGRLLITVADVSGHGASAAVLMGMFRALLNVFSETPKTAADLVANLNQALLNNIGDDPDFVTAFLGLVDLNKLRLNFCAAGHGDMMILGPEKGQIQRLGAGGTILGCFPGTWQEEFLDLIPGQSLILYTDGLIEAVDEANEEFGRLRLETLLQNLNPEWAPERLVETIRSEVESFSKGTDFLDDVTLFVIKFF